MFMENSDECFIKFLLFIKNNSKIITHKEKHSKNIYIVVFISCFLLLLLFIKRALDVIQFEAFIFTDYLHIGEQTDSSSCFYTLLL